MEVERLSAVTTTKYKLEVVIVESASIWVTIVSLSSPE
jgi:hypothetical protein